MCSEKSHQRRNRKHREPSALHTGSGSDYLERSFSRLYFVTCCYLVFLRSVIYLEQRFVYVEPWFSGCAGSSSFGKGFFSSRVQATVTKRKIKKSQVPWHRVPPGPQFRTIQQPSLSRATFLHGFSIYSIFVIQFMIDSRFIFICFCKETGFNQQLQYKTYSNLSRRGFLFLEQCVSTDGVPTAMSLTHDCYFSPCAPHSSRFSAPAEPFEPPKCLKRRVMKKRVRVLLQDLRASDQTSRHGSISAVLFNYRIKC